MKITASCNAPTDLQGVPYELLFDGPNPLFYSMNLHLFNLITVNAALNSA